MRRGGGVCRLQTILTRDSDWGLEGGSGLGRREGGAERLVADSDVRLTDSDVWLTDSDVRLTDSDVRLTDSDVR